MCGGATGQNKHQEDQVGETLAFMFKTCLYDVCTCVNIFMDANLLRHLLLQQVSCIWFNAFFTYDLQQIFC